MSALDVIQALEVALLAGDENACREFLGEMDKLDAKNDGSRARLIDRSVTGETGLTALHVSCLGKSQAVARLVLERAPNLLGVDAKQRLPLHCAVTGGNVQVLKALCEKLDERAYTAKCLTIRDSRGLTPLHLACGRPTILSFLVQYARSPEQIWNCPGLFKHCVASPNSTACLEALLNVGETGDGESPQVDSAILNQRSSEQDKTLFIVAVEAGCLETAKLLYKLGADPTLCDAEQQNAMHWAAFLDHSAIYDWLHSIDQANDMKTQIDSSGKTPQDYLWSEDTEEEQVAMPDKKSQAITVPDLATGTYNFEETKDPYPSARSPSLETGVAQSWHSEEAKLAEMCSDLFLGNSEDGHSNDDDYDEEEEEDSEKEEAEEEEEEEEEEEHLIPETDKCSPPQAPSLPRDESVKPKRRFGEMALWKHDKVELERALATDLLLNSDDDTC